MADNRALRQFLQAMKSSGISFLPHVVLPKIVSPAHRLARSTSVATRKTTDVAAAPASSLLQDSAEVRPPAALKETVSLLAQVHDTTPQKAQALSQLATIVANCTRCSELVDSRRQTVFGVGDPNADVMFIGEAPGADEDRAGEPFVGAAGQLLDKIIVAAGLKRENIYICNVLRCRPPGNRNPQAQEAANCREFLDGQIKIVSPKYIVCWGTVAAQNVLGTTDAVGKLRGRFCTHNDAKVLCTYHPAYLLRNPAAKKLVWDDMKLLMAELGLNAD